jgi:hypothetical protein
LGSILKDHLRMARDLATDDAVIMEGSIWMVMESNSRNGNGEIDQ